MNGKTWKITLQIQRKMKRSELFIHEHEVIHIKMYNSDMLIQEHEVIRIKMYNSDKKKCETSHIRGNNALLLKIICKTKVQTVMWLSKSNLKRNLMPKWWNIEIEKNSGINLQKMGGEIGGVLYHILFLWDINLILSNSLITLVEAIVDHALKQSLLTC